MRQWSGIVGNETNEEFDARVSTGQGIPIPGSLVHKETSRPGAHQMRQEYRLDHAVELAFFAGILSSSMVPKFYGQESPATNQETVSDRGHETAQLRGASQSSDLNRDDAAAPTAPAQGQTAPPQHLWHYGGFTDLGYLVDFNFPSNHQFRSRSTAWRVNELDLNMAGVYVSKDASAESRWGTQLTLQGGRDSEGFGFSPTAPNVAGAKWLRHLGLANLSYLAPYGKGLTVQAGLFNSLIGYDSLYAKDNFSYTRPWGADWTPHLMFGVNASYPFNQKLSGTLFVVNGYWHLAHANNIPSSGGQLGYKATDRVTLKETVLYGPHQSDTSPEFWRFLSDSIAERKGNRVTTALEYQVGTERVAVPGSPRALWISSQLPVHWAEGGLWSVRVRPEFAWDRDGRWTGSAQTVTALTSTLEYRVPYRRVTAILRLEHRYDNSRGKGGGFFKAGEVSPGVDRLTPTQHLFIFAFMLTFDSSY
jgi:putative OmpL-like beta-barrel porin-2